MEPPCPSTFFRHRKGHLWPKVLQNARYAILPQLNLEKMKTPTPKNNTDGNLLFTLEEISHLVSHSHNAAETLENIVRLIQNRFQVAVCSFYLYQAETKELILAATLGLRPEMRGRLRMGVDEGLTGLVAQRLGPVMVPDAPKHPRFKYFADAGEESYQTFLGVPLVETGILKGVLVVQTVESRHFTAGEIRMLVAVGAQVAPLVGDALLLERVAASIHMDGMTSPRPPASGESRQGISLSPGAGLGLAYLVDEERGWAGQGSGIYLGAEREKERLVDAMSAARDELAKQAHQISNLVGEYHGAILQAQQMLLQDNSLVKELGERIENGSTTESALQSTLEAYVRALSEIRTPLVQERIYDIKDVFHRILWQLRRHETKPQGQGRTGNSGKIVLVCRESTVMELFAVDLDRLAGIVVERGGPQSHAAILARSLGIPMVSGFPDFSRQIPGGTPLWVDGQAGRVVIDPPKWMVPDYEIKSVESFKDQSPLKVDASSCPVPLLANVNFLAEANQAYSLGAQGIGLFRTEFLFLARRSMPSEEEQVSIYRKLLNAMNGKTVTIRTFDLRPDKVEGGLNLQHGGWEALDWRDVLQSTSLQTIFREQIRAILRASQNGQAKILVPLVTTTELLDFLIETLSEVKKQLIFDGLEYDNKVDFGVMIEAASSIPLMADWCDQVDFFSLGTNDLTASAMGVDRDSPISSHSSHRFNPGVIRLIYTAIVTAKQNGKTVTACGELASDPFGYWLLMALGISQLSVPVRKIGDVLSLSNLLPLEAILRYKPTIIKAKSAIKLSELFQEFQTANSPAL